MRFRILGPIEVHTDDRQRSLGGPRQRATLGFLLLHANKVVSITDLLDALWQPDHMPLSARKVIQNSIYSIRRRVLPSTHSPQQARLITRPPGYSLTVEENAVDLNVFRAKVHHARADMARGESAEAAGILREALDLWRGDALADLVEDGTRWPELATVEEERLDAIEDYLEAAIAYGAHHTAIGYLGGMEGLIDASPRRERLAEQLMLALYRCGRQADALHFYSRIRSALVEQLAIDPDRRLRTLHESILRQDPRLMSAASECRRRLPAHGPTAFETVQDVVTS